MEAIAGEAAERENERGRGRGREREREGGAAVSMNCVVRGVTYSEGVAGEMVAKPARGGMNLDSVGGGKDACFPEFIRHRIGGLEKETGPLAARK